MNDYHGVATIKSPNKIDGGYRKSCLKILSWNINDMTDKTIGSKQNDIKFMDNVEQCDVFCLQETKGDVKIPNFKCFNKTRQDSRSGGVCIGIRHEIASYTKLVNNRLLGDDIIAIKFDDTLLGYKLLLINTYDSPENSSYKLKKARDGLSEDTLSKIEEFLAEQDDDCNVFTAGDFNARTASINGPSYGTDSSIYNALNNEEYSQSSYPLIDLRNSKDKIINERGKKLLDLINLSNMRILNGSTIGDIMGNYTCYRYNGCSVVDYMIVSHSLLRHINSFKVMNLCPISDHKPLICTIHGKSKLPSNSSTPDEPTFADQPLRFKWDKEHSKTPFIEAQNNEQVLEACANIMSRVCYNEADVYQLNKALTDVFTDVASEALDKTKPPSNPTTKRPGITRKKVWFDYECIQAKRLLNKATAKFDDEPENEDIRNAYYQKLKLYKQVTGSKKAQYLSKLNKDIEYDSNIRWKTNQTKMTIDHNLIHMTWSTSTNSSKICIQLFPCHQTGMKRSKMTRPIYRD